MKIFKGCFIFLWGWVLYLIFSPIQALAFCPVCVVATGTGVGLFRWLGVDDTIIGLWVGGFIVSLAILINNYLSRKGKKFRFQFPLILSGLYLLATFLLAWGGFFDLLYNRVLGINKAILGIVAGSLLLAVVPRLDKFLRGQNHGKIFISHQKVLIAVVLLIIFSFILYFTLK